MLPPITNTFCCNNNNNNNNGRNYGSGILTLFNLIHHHHHHSVIIQAATPIMMNQRRNYSLQQQQQQQRLQMTSTTSSSYHLNKLFPIYSSENIKSSLSIMSSQNNTISLSDLKFDVKSSSTNIQTKKQKKLASKFSCLSIVTKHTVSFVEEKTPHEVKLVPKLSSGEPILRISNDPIHDIQTLNRISTHVIKGSNKINHYRLHAIIYNWNSALDCLQFESKLHPSSSLKQIFVKMSNLFTNPNSECYIGSTSSPTFNNGKLLHVCLVSRAAIECVASIQNPLYKEMMTLATQSQQYSTNMENDHSNRPPYRNQSPQVFKTKNYELAFKMDDMLFKRLGINL